MPKLRPLTQAQKEQEAILRQRQRTAKILRFAMVQQNIRTASELARRCGFSPPKLCRILNAQADLPMESMIKLADALKLDAMSRAAILGAKEKCPCELATGAA